MKLTIYEKIVTDINQYINPVGVVCMMREAHHTLDALDIAQFRMETLAAASCEREQPGFLRRMADSYGHVEPFDEWNAEHGYDDPDDEYDDGPTPCDTPEINPPWWADQ